MFAVIEVNTNLWYAEARTLVEAKEQLRNARMEGKPSVLVQVLIDEETELEPVPDIFEDVAR